MQGQAEPTDARPPGVTELDEATLAELRRLLSPMRHGSVTLIVQDGRVIQIDATHKLRLEAGRLGRTTARPR